MIYDDLGGLNASRLYRELEGPGHQRIALLDVRTRQEYAGDPRQPRSGHIPTAQRVAVKNRHETLRAALNRDS